MWKYGLRNGGHFVQGEKLNATVYQIFKEPTYNMVHHDELLQCAPL